MSDPAPIPFAQPDHSEDEVEELVATLRSGWTTTGPRADQFEKDFRAYTGASHALAVNSCTSGLHVALVACGIGAGDEVITTPMTFCSTVNVIIQTGATPILADIGGDLNIDPEAIARAITPRTRAILPVHIGGLPCDMQAIWKIAARHNLKVIEDAAHAAGSRYTPGPGSLTGEAVGKGKSDAVAFSFYATKNLSTGEGGMVTTGSAELESRMRILLLHGISRDAWKRCTEKAGWYYEVVECGFKYNMSDLTAAIGLHQLRRLDQMNARRAQIAARYTAAFRPCEELEVAPSHPEAGHSWHLYVLRLNLQRLQIDRARFFEEMGDRGIGCSVHFIPIPLHPYYQRTLEMHDPCTRALAEYPRLLSLPLYSGMSDESVERVIAGVQEIVEKYRCPRTA